MERNEILEKMGVWRNQSPHFKYQCNKLKALWRLLAPEEASEDFGCLCDVVSRERFLEAFDLWRSKQDDLNA